MIAASAVAAGPAFADEAMGVPIIDYYLPSAAERTTGAGATLRVPQGWSATLFVSSLGPRRGADDGVPQLKSSTFVNARLGRNLTKDTRVTFDVFNVFDRRADNLDYFATARAWNPAGAGDNFLFNPAEPRGFRIKLRTTF